MDPIPLFLVAYATLVPGLPVESTIQPGAIGFSALRKVGSGLCIYDLDLSPEMVGALPLTKAKVDASVYCDRTLNAAVSVGPAGALANPATTVRVTIIDTTTGNPFPEPAFEGFLQVAINRIGPTAPA